MRTKVFALGVAVAASACASAGSSDVPVGDDVVDPDAASNPDDPDAARIDATPLAIDAMPIDAMPIDAMPIDAMPSCVVQTTQLLLNPGFDGTPQGASWVQAPFNATYPMIGPLDDLAIAEHSGTMAAWLNGYAVTATDRMYQDVAIPASTTALTITGYRWIDTRETTAVTVYDRVWLEVLNTSDGVLATLATWSNLDHVAAWTAFSFNAGSYAGQTIRIHLRSSSDSSNATSFMFDTLVLDATVCL